MALAVHACPAYRERIPHHGDTMRPLAPLALALTLCLSSSARAADATSHAADVAAIGQVVEQFKAAIIAHDGKTLDSLFLPGHDSWLEVPDAKTWAEIKSRHPDAPRWKADTRRHFVDAIQTGAKPVEERFYKVRIDTNGAVGSVWFDFNFLDDGKVTNRGSETWQMVHDDDGWKIAAMLYSLGR
jgi:ketosteroid isomerase-like protein